MKAKGVSALRSERGLRPEERAAEPQVVGLTPQTPENRKPNTMKTYLLRDPNAVEPQNPPRARPSQPTSAPAPAAPVHTILGRATASGPALFLGLDVPNDSIAVPLALSDSTEVRRYGIIGGQHDDVLKPIKML